MHEIAIPETFWATAYNGAHFPGAAGVSGLAGGANCQQFAYELLRCNGFVIADLRSSALWADMRDTMPAGENLAAGDLLLFNRTAEAWGAHVAVCLNRHSAIHLAKRVGRPAIWTLAEFAAIPRYACFVGAKRPIRRAPA